MTAEARKSPEPGGATLLRGAIGGVCGLIGLLAWAFYGWGLRHCPEQDWMVYYAAVHGFLTGQLPLIFDASRLTADINQRFAGWLSTPLGLHPWVYPPSFLLLFLPLGMVPPLMSAVLFQLVSLAGVFAAVWHWQRTRLARGVLLFGLLLFPAAPLDVMVGQNGFMMAALLLGGLGLLERRPLWAGALLGLLSAKPQLALLVPLALVAARQWRALGAAGVSALGLALGSLWVFGAEIWRVWFGVVSGTAPAYRIWADVGRLNGINVYACVRVLGGGEGLANLAQLVAVLVAAGAVLWGFRRALGARPELRAALLLAATILAEPHGSAADAVLVGLAVGLLVIGMGDALRVVHAVVAMAVWVGFFFMPPHMIHQGLVAPLVLLLLLVTLVDAMVNAAPQCETRTTIAR